MEERSKEELKDLHWSEIMVDELIKSKKPPYVVTGGVTTSGPVHFGSVSEFLYPYIVKEALKERGFEASYTFIGDIVDPFKSIPDVIKSTYEKELTPELGKPLAHVMDPFRCHNSFGEHYLAEIVDVMHRMDLEINIVKSNELYESGAFDKYTRLYFKEEAKVRDVVARSSMKTVEDMADWSIIMPICANCGKISTTRVTWHNDEEYEYACDKEVTYTKSCNFRGKNKISDHKYKLQWRLHWPTWHAHFGTSIEGAGADHIGKGKSSDSATAVAKEILNRDPPMFYKFGLIMLHGKKYSKSKGIGMDILELLELIPAELLKYALTVPNLPQNKEIDPTGDKLVLLYEDIERIARMKQPESRADEKKMLAFKLSVGKLKWSAPFLDVMLNYQIYKDWDKVGASLKDTVGVKYLSPYISEWLSRDYEPERYNFAVKPQKISAHKETVTLLSSALKPGMSDIEVHNLIYAVAKESNVNASELFTTLYNAMIGKDSGPKLGKLIAAVGIDRTKEILDSATS